MRPQNLKEALIDDNYAASYAPSNIDGSVKA